MNRKKSSWKGLMLTMGLLTLLTNAFGCTKGTNDVETPSLPDDEFGIEGEDFSQNGSGEYKKVTKLEFYVNGYGPCFTYDIHKDDEDANKTILVYENMEDGISEMICEVDDETIEKLSKLCAQCNVVSWDGFNRNAKGVLDGSGFGLYADFEDGTHVGSHGSNSFPKHYSEFEKGIIEIFKPVVENYMSQKQDELYQSGAYNQPLKMAMINYKGRGASGSDSYSFLFRDSTSTGNQADVTVKSVSGDLIEAGNYRYCDNPENIDELLAGIQDVLVKYDVYKWNGYDKSTDDFNDREWFQLDFYYPEASIKCCGCGDTEHYEEVRAELLQVIFEYMKPYL